MGDSLSRRMFLRRAAAVSGSVIIGFDPGARSWILQGQARPRAWRSYLRWMEPWLLTMPPSRLFPGITAITSAASPWPS